MASIRRDIEVAAAVAPVWDALRDVGRIHERLVRGFVTDCRLEGDTRTVTFANGMTVRERIVTIDDSERRVVWSVAERAVHPLQRRGAGLRCRRRPHPPGLDRRPAAGRTGTADRRHDRAGPGRDAAHAGKRRRESLIAGSAISLLYRDPAIDRRLQPVE